jgi:hypothetical protein
MSETFKERTIPTAAQDRLASWIRCAIETYSLHPDWEFCRSTAKGKGDSEYFEIEGGVYKTCFKRGPRKGEINYRAPEPGTGCTVVLPRKLYKQWLERWEREMGLCSACEGSGRTLASCGVSGTTYRTCSKCSGSGEAQASRSAA